MMSVVERLIRRKIRWEIWGTKVEFLSPRRPCVSEMVTPTKLDAPGHESLRFYESYYDKALNVRHELHEIINAASEFPSFEDFSNAFFKRERFWGEWSCGREGTYEYYSLSVQGVVYRDTDGGSFFDPVNLKNAHLRHCETGYKHDKKRYEDSKNSDSSILAFPPGFSDLRWRKREVSGQCWHGYDHYNYRHKTGEVWLIPLGNDHYMAVQLGLRCVHQVFQEYIDHFDRFVDRFFNSLNITYSPELLSYQQRTASPEAIENAVDPVVLGYTGDDLIQWRLLNTEEGQLNKKLALSSLKKERLDTLKHNLLLPGILLGMIVLVLGFIGLSDAIAWLNERGFSSAPMYFSVCFGYLALRGKILKKLYELKDASDA